MRKGTTVLTVSRLSVRVSATRITYRTPRTQSTLLSTTGSARDKRFRSRRPAWTAGRYLMNLMFINNMLTLAVIPKTYSAIYVQRYNSRFAI